MNFYFVDVIEVYGKLSEKSIFLHGKEHKKHSMTQLFHIAWVNFISIDYEKFCCAFFVFGFFVV